MHTLSLAQSSHRQHHNHSQVPLGQLPDTVWTAVADAGQAHREGWDYWRTSGLYPCSPQGYDSSSDWMNGGSARTQYHYKL